MGSHSSNDAMDLELEPLAHSVSIDIPRESIEEDEAHRLLRKSDRDQHEKLIPLRQKGIRAFCAGLKNAILAKPPPQARNIILSRGLTNRAGLTKFAPNVVRNQKYHPSTFLFVVLFEQFKFFFNLYFLLVALSQFVPALQIGFFFTYMAPLAFVLLVTISKEAWDDFKRYRRDREANQERYMCLTEHGFQSIPSSDIKVGDLIVVRTNQRVPADLVLLRTTEKSGASFIRTDQLDGETDWKLRHAVTSCQRLSCDDDLLHMEASMYVEAPKKEIYEFVGTFTRHEIGHEEVEPLTLENTLWASTVVASGTVIGLVVYTGAETRSVMNASVAHTKVGKVDLEINRLSKVLVFLTVGLSVLLVAMKGFRGAWIVSLFRFMLLLSSIIPISLRVNLDMGKTAYSVMIMRDKKIPGTIVRTSTIPEELGRIEYLFTDKTGTLTRNEMQFQKLHLGSKLYMTDSIAQIRSALRDVSDDDIDDENIALYNAVKAIALCHNVTPSMDEGQLTYQAASPDEVALVRFAESAGMILSARDLHTITLTAPSQTLDAGTLTFDVLNLFPFTSASKRMGIIVRDQRTGAITFYMKGADTVMAEIVQYNEWLEEECGNMAREGLRTLVYACKQLSEEEYQTFAARYATARASITQRDANIAAVVASLERDLMLIGVTGVEDRLQDQVKESLEMLRSAGVKIWMLTGDKVETATCIAVSTKLVCIVYLFIYVPN